LDELARPTFTKIGLSDFCRFVSNEVLYALMDKSKDSKGTFNHPFLTPVAVELELE